MNDNFWWRLSVGNKRDKMPTNAHEQVYSTLKAIDSAQSYRSNHLLECWQYYCGTDKVSATLHGYSRVLPSDQFSWNAVKVCVNADVAAVTSNNVKPTPVTNDGDYNLRKQAKFLDLFAQGAFMAIDYKKKSIQAYQDACIFGTGALKLTPNVAQKKLGCEVVFCGDLFVDDCDASSGNPRRLYQRIATSRDMAVYLYPEHKTEIMNAAGIEKEEAYSYGTTSSDMIYLYEAWSLPSGPGANDGRHFIGIETCTFVFEEWERESFPFVFFRRNIPSRGFWGTGIASELFEQQREINRLLFRIREAHNLCGSPWVMVEESSNVDDSRLNNGTASVIRYRGTPPSIQVFQTIPPEIYGHLSTLWDKCFELAGLSKTQATATRPSGLNSGEAQRVFNDTVSGIGYVRSVQWEQSAIDMFHQLLLDAKQIEEEEGSFFVNVYGRQFGKRFMKKVSFSKIDIDRDDYVLQVFPTSTLPTHPSGRIAALEDRLRLGVIGPEDVIEQMDLPDTERQNSLLVASRRNIEELCWRFLYSDEEDIPIEEVYRAPEAFQDLSLGIKLMGQEYLSAQLSGVPDERLELVRRWIEDAVQMQTPNEPTQEQSILSGAPQTPNAMDPGMMQAMPQVTPEQQAMAQLMPQPQGA